MNKDASSSDEMQGSERSRIVKWIRSEAAVTLWRDMHHFPPSMHHEVESVAAILDAYADAIERGDHFRD